MTPKLIEITRIVSTTSALIPVFIGFIRFKRLSPLQRFLVVIVSLSFLVDTAGGILLNNRTNNLPLYNAYALVNFNLLWFLYQKEIPKLKNRIIWGSQIAINLFAFVNVWFIQYILSFNSNLILLCSISFIVLACYSFYQLLIEIKFTRLEKNPIFWINSGVIVYYSSTLILFLLSNQINDADTNAYNLHLASWGLNSFFNVLLNTAYSIALWVKATK